MLGVCHLLQQGAYDDGLVCFAMIRSETGLASDTESLPKACGQFASGWNQVPTVAVQAWLPTSKIHHQASPGRALSSSHGLQLLLDSMDHLCLGLGLIISPTKTEVVVFNGPGVASTWQVGA